jgi:hypothetical protein
MLSELHIKVVAINMGYLRNIRNLSFPTIQTYIPKQTKKNQLIKFKLVAVNKKNK